MIITHATNMPFVQGLLPGGFQVSPDGSQVYYIEDATHEGKHLKNIFVAIKDSTSSPQAKDPKNAQPSWQILTAQSGVKQQDTDPSTPPLKLSKGFRYWGRVGSKDFRIAQFDDFAFFPVVPKRPLSEKASKKTLSTLALWQKPHKTLSEVAELQWRASVPISVFILWWIAIPLSEVKPRKGRYARLFPGLLLYVYYANLLIAARGWVSSGALPPVLGIGWVHLSMLVVGAFLWWPPRDFFFRRSAP